MNREQKRVTLAALGVLRRRLGLYDVGFSPNKKAIYLLSGVRKLEGLIRNPWPIMALLKRHEGPSDVTVWNDYEWIFCAALSRLTKLRDENDWDFFDGWDVIPVPRPGIPTGVWISSRNMRRMAPAKPPVYRVCDTKPVDFGSSPSKPILFGASFAGLPLMLSHSLHATELDKVEKKCGGSLLWPSWALSWRIPAGYGDVTFVAAPAEVVGHLASRTRGVTIHGSDAWTYDTRLVLQWEAAVNRERRGDLQWWRGAPSNMDSTAALEQGYFGDRSLQHDLVSSGFKPEEITGGMAPDEAAEIRTVGALRKRMKHLIDVYDELGRERRAQSLAGEGSYARVDVMDLDFGDDYYPRGGDRYDYAEVKCQGVVPVRDLPMVVYPSRRARKVEGFLDRVGFRGWRLRVKWAGDLPIDGYTNFERDAAWAHARTMAILKWAATLQKTGYPPRGVSIPEAVADPGSPQAVAEYKDKFAQGYDPAYTRAYAPYARISRGYDYTWGDTTNADRAGYIRVPS